MDHVLLDTDVILDILLDREPYSLYSTKVFRLCESKKIKGYITPLTYSNVYYILRRNSKQEKVIAALKQLLSITDVLSMDSDIVTNALYSKFNDFEDGLQHYSALKNTQIEVILTRNTKDYRHSEIGVMVPESYVKLIETL